MKLKSVEIENYRAIDELRLPLHSTLTVLHGDNAHGKTSVLSAIAVGLGRIPELLPDVSGIAFRKRDRRVGHKPMRVKLKTTEEVVWQRRTAQLSGHQSSKHPTSPKLPVVERTLKEEIDAVVAADSEGSKPIDLPIVAFYDTDRAVFGTSVRRHDLTLDLPRYHALEGALAARPNFREFFMWFYNMENEELRVQRQQGNFKYQMKELDAVRRAITTMVREVSSPHIELRPFRFVVSVASGQGRSEELALDQLSGGYRIMLAVAADLARRMAQGNPHLDDPLSSEAIVLIDEIELHLHPSWQQRILTDLTRTFPKTQFIVSTHSPQVLTTLRPDQIVKLGREEGRIVAGGASEPTYGAEAGDVLATVMGVDERPNGNEFVNTLNRYMDLVGSGKGETKKALSLRSRLESLSPRDYALDRADIEIRRQKLLKNMGRSE